MLTANETLAIFRILAKTYEIDVFSPGQDESLPGCLARTVPAPRAGAELDSRLSPASAYSFSTMMTPLSKPPWPPPFQVPA